MDHCDYSVAQEGMICKHTVKVFKMLHLDIEDGVIFREACTKHGINHGTPLWQCFARPSQQLVYLDPHSTQPTVGTIRANLHDNVLHIGEDKGHIAGGHADPILIDSQDPDDMITNIVVGDARNPIDLSQERLSQSGPKTKVHDIYVEMTRTADEYLTL